MFPFEFEYIDRFYVHSSKMGVKTKKMGSAAKKLNLGQKLTYFGRSKCPTSACKKTLTSH